MILENTMLTDRRLSKLVDFENFSEVFPGVDVAGGVCYFLWEKDYSGPCEIANSKDGVITKTKRELNEFDIFIRNNLAVPIITKVAEIENPKHYLNKVISSSKPFGIRGFYKPKKTGIPCHFAQRVGLKYAAKEDITDRFKFLDKWKLLIPKSPIAGQTDFSKPVGFYYDGNTRIAKPGECCTETYLVAFASKSKEEVESFKSYLFTKIARFLLLQAVVSQDITREKFMFVPHLDRYDRIYTDQILRERWNMTDEEWSFIDSKIRDI
jgi:site-specific DNA-methyltransferase (adenine-specific)